MIGFSVLALDSCGLGQGEGELSVKELWLDIREKVTEQLSNLLSDRCVIASNNMGLGQWVDILSKILFPPYFETIFNTYQNLKE